MNTKKHKQKLISGYRDEYKRSKNEIIKFSVRIQIGKGETKHTIIAVTHGQTTWGWGIKD